MVYLNLQHQVFKEIHLSVNIQKGMKLEVESTFSFNVNYVEKDTKCIACLKQEIKEKTDSSKFSVSVEGIGIFACEDINSPEDKKQAHIQSYNLLFPYVQNMISSLTISAGLPPLMIKMANMKVEDISIEENKL